MYQQDFLVEMESPEKMGSKECLGMTVLYPWMEKRVVQAGMVVPVDLADQGRKVPPACLGPMDSKATRENKGIVPKASKDQPAFQETKGITGLMEIKDRKEAEESSVLLVLQEQ